MFGEPGYVDGPRPEQKNHGGVNFQAAAAINGYIIAVMGMPTVVVEVANHGPEEFEKVLDALREAFIKSRRPVS